MSPGKTLYVAPESTVALSDAASRRYDALLCSVGYETRSRSVAAALGECAGDVSAVGFLHGHSEVYERNRQYFESAGASVTELDDEAFGPRADAWLEQHASADAPLLAIDISSMSRPRIAAAVQGLLGYVGDRTLTVDFLYVPEQYEAAPQPADATTALEPVTPAFAGWDDPDLPTVVLFGLGYEPGRAAGAIDWLEPTGAIPFMPLGVDSRFDDDVRETNAQVLELPKVLPPQPYRIVDPFECFAGLESFVSELERNEQRPVLLPMGPKVFALASMLAAAAHDPVTPVWRVSPGPLDEPTDRHPEDVLITLRVANGPMRLDGSEAN